MLICFSYVQLFVTLWLWPTMGFSRQGWSGLPCPPPGDLPDLGIKLASACTSCTEGRFFTHWANWEGQSNNNLVIKQNQGLSYYHELQVIFWAMSFDCFVDTENPTRWKKLTIWEPDCSHDINCQSSENWPQRNRNNPTLELKTNCT